MYQNNLNTKSINTAKADYNDLWYNQSFLYRKQITIPRSINTVPNVPHTDSNNTNPYLSNFPVLISTTIPTNKVRSDHNDIIFTNQAGTQLLTYEIESYDTNGNLTAWVKLPQLNDANNTADTSFYVYYDNSTYTDTTSNVPGSTWNSNFKGVWHLGETTRGAAADFKDSTVNANNSTNTTNEPTAIAGQIDGAGSFNGSSSYVDAGNRSSLNITNAITISAWIYPTNLSNLAHRIVSKESATAGSSNYVMSIFNNKLNFTSNDLSPVEINSNSTFYVNTLYHVVAVYTGSTFLLYVNGNLEKSVSVTGAMGTSTRNLQIGRFSSNYPQLFNGTLDEVRISDAASSADWIRTEYNNESSPSAFYILGSEESYTQYSTPPVIAEVTPVSTSTTNAAPSYTFSSTKSGNITYGGDCSSSTTSAVSGNNAITFNTLSSGTHSTCTIKVTDGLGNQSNTLSVTSFTINLAVATYVVPAITDNKILPKSAISSSYLGDTISAQVSSGEYKAASFAINSNVNINALQVEVSNLTGNGNIISNTAVDIKTVKCWYQGSAGMDLTIRGRYLTPELLLKDDSLVSVDGDTWTRWDTSNPNGKNYLKMNGSYVDISSSTPQLSGRTIIPISDRPIQDASTLQPVNLPANYNKQFWVTLHVPDNTPAGNYTGTVILKSGNQTVKSLSVNIQVLPINLPQPNAEYSIYYRGFIDNNGSISSENKTVQQYTAEMQDMRAHGINNPTIYGFGTDSNLLQELSIRQQAGIDNTNMYSLGNTGGNIPYYKNLTAPYGVVNLYQYGADEQNLNTPAGRVSINNIHNTGGMYFVAQSYSQADSVADVLDLAIVSDSLSSTLATKYHSYGHKIYSYANPQTTPEYPRTFRMNYGFALWQNNYDGAMDYAYQDAYDVWNDFNNAEGYRSGVFAYPTMNGVIDTVQYEGFREGVNDMRYLAALQSAIAVAKSHGGDATATEAENYLTSLKDSDLPSQDLDVIRSQMINYIIALSSSAHSLTINHGTDSGFYKKDSQVTITANASQSGMVFNKWTGDTQYISNVNSATATVTMPSYAISLTATYTSSWYNNNYSYRKNIIIDHTKVSNIDQSNFPVLISLTDVSLKNITNGGKMQNPNGYDVVFTLSNGTLLNYEIESYDNTTGKLVAWLKIPTLSHTNDTFLYMYYGNPNIMTSQENKIGVWDTDFKGVWHLGDTPSGHAAGDYKDSTINANNSTNTTNEPTTTAGQVDGAQTFDGSSSYVNVGNNSSLNITSAITISAWVNPSALVDRSYEGIIWKQNASDMSQSTAYALTTYYSSPKKPELFLTTSTGNGQSAVGNTSITLNQWQYISATYDSSTGTTKFYRNGSPDGSSSSITGTINITNSPVNIGRRIDYFNGTLDEVRISDTARSDDWIKTEYNNQSSPSTFSTLSSEETILPPTITSLSANLPTGTYGTGTTIPITINFSKDVTSTGNITLTLNTIPQRTCSFTVTNNNSATCNYTVQSGDFANGLNVTTISGNIHDQFNNPMTNFTPTSSLSDNTTITINTSSSPFIPPTKPNITNINITVLDNGTTTFNLPSNITQIAISRTPDFANVSWQDFDQNKFSHINETQETLYLKFRTNEGAVSDTIIITPQTGINNTISLIDGDIIQCKSSNDPNAVYIVKIIGTKTYIRHITSIQIFNYYKHLKWENLKQVDSLTPFSLSSWIRVNTNTNGLPKAEDKVYEINGDQTKHWINMTSNQFLSHGGSDEAIYTVNAGELNLYSAGADVVSL